MADFRIPSTASFVSPSNPSHKILYLRLNAGGSKTLLFCYGAGDRSATLTLYQEFTRKHPNVSLLCIDRWTLPTSPGAVVARTGLEILSEFTSITTELLDSLSVHKFSIAAHSAGAYPMLFLANSVPDRVEHLFPICTHIPSPFNGSRVLSYMSSMPNFLFQGITKLDSGGDASPIIERFKEYAIGTSNVGDEFVDSMALRSLMKQYRPTSEESAAAKERQSLDYQLVYSRLPGVDDKALADMYMSLRKHAFTVTWFTSHGDVFFGPSSVQRIIEATKIENGIEVVIVQDAKHSDIHFRREVWDGMYQRMMGVEL